MNCPFSDRYYVVKISFFSYAVLCGTGTRILFKSWSKYAALKIAAELSTAFYDGKFVGESSK